MEIQSTEAQSPAFFPSTLFSQNHYPQTEYDCLLNGQICKNLTKRSNWRTKEEEEEEEKEKGGQKEEDDGVKENVWRPTAKEWLRPICRGSLVLLCLVCIHCVIVSLTIQ